MRHWSFGPRSQTALMMSRTGYVPTGSKWTLLRPRFSGQLPADIFTSCRSFSFLSALTKYCRLLLFMLMLMSQCGLALPKPACFAVLHQLHCIRRSVPRSVLQSLVTSLVLSRLDTATQCSPVFRRTLSRGFSLWWTRLFGWCFHCEVWPHHPAPLSTALVEGERADWFQAGCPRVEMSAWDCSVIPCRWTLPAAVSLRSTSSPSLIVRYTRRSTIGDRAFPVAGSRVWNSLPQHVSLHPHCLSSAAASRLTSLGVVSHNIFHSCIVPAQWQ